MGGDRNLSVKVPSLFRCPISLDVMRSPVILSTGVTYDRSSIQRWLQSGHATCPATMQPLPSTDLVPDLVLRRLIHLWSRDLTCAGHVTLDSFEGAADGFEKNQLARRFAEDPLFSHPVDGEGSEAVEEVVRVAARIVACDCIEEENKKLLAQNLERAIPSIILVLREGRNVESRANAAVVIDAILANAESGMRLDVAEDMIPDLIRLIGDGGDEKTNEAGLSCLSRLSGIRSARSRMVRLGIVPMLARMLERVADDTAMKLMESAAGCREGREAICEDAEVTIPAILGKLMRFGRGGTESAVAVLWGVCCLFKDRRAREAAAAEGSRGMTKMLVVMQGGCSPAVREMAGDLLRMFRVSCKGCVVGGGGGYDTKTTHIMPF